MRDVAEGDYRLSATLLLNDQLSGKLRSVASQLKSLDGAASRFGSSINGEVARLATQFNALANLRKQVEQFKQMKKSVAATQQAFNQSNATTAQLARQYRQGQSAVAQLKAKHDDLAKTFESSQAATSQLKTKLGDMKARLKESGAKEEYQNLQSQIKATSEQLKASQAMTRRTGAELKALAGGVRQAQRELNAIGKAFEESKAKASKLKRELTQQRPALDQMRRGLAAQGFSTKDFAQSERDLRRRMDSTAQKLYIAQKQQHLREALAAAGMGQGKPISVNVSGNATSQLSKIKAQLQSLTGKAWNVAVNAKNAIGGKLNDFATGAAMGVGIPFLGTAGAAYGAVDFIKTYKDFEYEMKTVSAITGAYRDASGQRLADLTERAKYYGETTMFKASEVASAEKYMAMAGWSDEYIKAGLKPLLDLAAASGEDLRRTSDIVTDAMTAFHLRPEEMYKLSSGQMVNVAEHFADVMAAMATSSNTDVNMAGEAAKYSGAIIGAMYSDQGIQDRMRATEDWAILTGAMANAGIKASMAGTATRSIFTRLSAMQMNADAARDILGVDLVYQQDDEFGHKFGQLRAPLEILDDIREKFQSGFKSAEELMNAVEYFDESGKRFTKQQRKKIGAMLESAQKTGGKLTKKDMLAMSNMLAGQEALSGLLAYLTSEDKDRDKLVEAIRNSHGRASEMANVKMDTLAGDLATLSSAWESFQLELMEGKGAEGFRNFTQGLTQDIRALKKSLEDGFDIGDIGGVVARIATQLKNKFLEFDGVGSILAGGALIMGMKKIYDWALKLKDAAIMVKTWWMGTASTMSRTPSTTSRTGGITQSVGSMVVHAGSVVVNGKVSSGTAPVTTTSPRPTTAPTPTGVASRFGSAAKVGVGAGILTGLFSIFDTYSTRSINQGRLSEAQAEYDAAKTEFTNAQEQYQEIVADPERAGELEEASAMSRQAAEKMRETSEALKVIQKEAAKHNNESLFGGAGAVAGATTGAAVGSVIPGAGTLVGGIVGAVLAIVGGYLGSEIGKDVGGNFEFDVLDRILGRDRKQPDWKIDEGKMFSELSYTEKADKLANMSAGEVERMTNSVQEQAKAEETVQMPTAAAVARHRVGAPEAVEQQPENLENKIASGATLTPAEMDQLNRQRGLAASAQAGMENTQRVQGFFQSVSDFFKIGMERYGKQAEFAKPENIFDGLKNNDGLAKVAEGFSKMDEHAAKGETATDALLTLAAPLIALGEMLDGTKHAEAAEQNFPPDYEGKPQFIDAESATRTLPETGFLDEIKAQFNFDNISEQIQSALSTAKETARAELEGFKTLLSESFDSALQGLGEKFSGISEQIQSALSSAKGVAETSLASITASFDSALQMIQNAWGALPGFFGSVFDGLGGVASAAGSAIASGLTSVIGMVIGAWQSAASTISGIIASIQSAASNVASMIPSFGGSVGHNATGTQSWRGGLTEIGEHGSEIINLPRGAKIYPHATTMKMLQREIQNGTFNDFISNNNDFISNNNDFISYDNGFVSDKNNFTSNNNDFTSINNQQINRSTSEEFSTFPQGFEFGEPTTSETTNNTTKSTGITISGNTFNIRKDSDIDEIVFKLWELLMDSNANYAGA